MKREINKLNIISMCNCKKAKVIQELPHIESLSDANGITPVEWDEVGRLISSHKLEYVQVDFLTNIYNRIFQTSKPVTTCKSCVKNLVGKLAQQYNSIKNGI